MVITFSIGSKCAVMLPREFLNPQLTPAKGMVVNRLVDNSSLILVEEVWQFKGLTTSPLQEMVTSTGRIKGDNWGWKELPGLIEDGEYIMLPVMSYNMMSADCGSFEALISKSVADFKNLHGF